MIVRETEGGFVLIKQHDHGLLSGEMAHHWGNDMFAKPDFQLVFTAAIHDMSWIDADSEPCWADGRSRPYDFIDFPLTKRLKFYEAGLNETEKIHPYSAFFISKHYCSFFSGKENESTALFLQKEQARQNRLMKSSPESLLNWERELSFLKLWDNLSLYVCLNEPGISKEKEHPWYRDGIPVNVNGLKQKRLSMKMD